MCPKYNTPAATSARAAVVGGCRSQLSATRIVDVDPPGRRALGPGKAEAEDAVDEGGAAPGAVDLVAEDERSLEQVGPVLGVDHRDGSGVGATWAEIVEASSATSTLRLSAVAPGRSASKMSPSGPSSMSIGGVDRAGSAPSGAWPLGTGARRTLMALRSLRIEPPSSGGDGTSLVESPE